MAKYSSEKRAMTNIDESKVYSFSDGSSIEWIDRETIKYQEAGRYAFIWVDYAPGFFSRGRILKSNSIEYWHYLIGDTEQRISNEERKTIIRKVIDYYAVKGVRLELDFNEQRTK